MNTRTNRKTALVISVFLLMLLSAAVVSAAAGNALVTGGTSTATAGPT